MEFIVYKPENKIIEQEKDFENEQCFICLRKKGVIQFKTDKDINLYICHKCANFHKKKFKKVLKMNIPEIVQNVTRMLSQYNKEDILKQINRISIYFSNSLPWKLVYAISIRYSDIAKKTNIDLKKSISIMSSIKLSKLSEFDVIYNEYINNDSFKISFGVIRDSIKPKRTASSVIKLNNKKISSEKLLLKRQKLLELKLSLENAIENINSAEDFISATSVIFKGIIILSASARFGNASFKGFRIFQLFHEKLNIYIKDIIQYNEDMAAKILEGIEPVYKVISEETFLDDCLGDYKRWKTLLKNIKESNLHSLEFNNASTKKTIERVILNNNIHNLQLLEPLHEEFKDILGFFQEHAWKEINARKHGLPGGDWYGSIDNNLLNRSNFYYYTIWEESGRFHSRIWPENKDGEGYYFNFGFCDKHPGSLLFTYILCSLADIFCERHIMSGRGVSENSIKIKNTKQEKKNTAYYPKRNYTANSKTTKENAKDKVKTIDTSYFVSWHFRQLRVNKKSSLEAKKKAMIIAGLSDLPEGFTFISPHWRGTGDNDLEKRIVTNRLTNSLTLTLEHLIKNNPIKI